MIEKAWIFAESITRLSIPGLRFLPPAGDPVLVTITSLHRRDFTPARPIAFRAFKYGPDSTCSPSLRTIGSPGRAGQTLSTLPSRNGSNPLDVLPRLWRHSVHRPRVAPVA